MSRPAPPSDVVAELARVLLRRVPSLTERLIDLILSEEPGYAQGKVVPADDLWQSCHDNMKHLIRGLISKPRTPAFYDPPVQTGRRRAAQGLPLESLLHAYRFGGYVLWEGLVNEARARGQSETDLLLDGATHVWELIDEFSTVVADSYRAAEADTANASEVRNQALVDALLEGRGAEAAWAKEASAALDLPIDGAYAVVVVELRAGSQTVFPQAANQLSGDGTRLVWRIRADRQIGVISLGDEAVRDVAERLRPVVHGRAGLSPAFTGFAEIRNGYELAEIALSTVPSDRDELALLDRNFVPALVVSAPEVARRLARVVLAGLLELQEADRALYVETLDVYLNSGGSVSQTAGRLFCHRNTVLNRLRRVENLIDCNLQDPNDIVQVSLALHALRLLG